MSDGISGAPASGHCDLQDKEERPIMEQKSSATQIETNGWIEMIGIADAQGRLREIYEQMRARGSSRPAVYNTPNGDVPNIVKSHSLDPEGLRLAFGMSSVIH